VYEPKYGNGWICGGKVYDPMSFDTQIVRWNSREKLMWESHTMDEK
jgi:hypothetical protein